MALARMDKTTLQAMVLGTGCLVASAAVLKYYRERLPKGCAKVRGTGWLLGTLPDVWRTMLRFEAHSEIGFGADIGSLENPVSPFLQSFDEAQRIIFKRFVQLGQGAAVVDVDRLAPRGGPKRKGLPGWRVLRWLGLGPEANTRHHMTQLRRYSRQIVEDLQGSLEKPAGDSFVGLFMKKEPGLHVEFLADLVMNFLIAGRDTTAQAMSWCLYQEVESVSGGKALTYDQLSQLSYTDAVLREALRLHPSVPLDSKFVNESVTLPDGTFAPKGSMVVYNSYAMGRSQAIWGEDAAEFRPERSKGRGTAMTPVSTFQWQIMDPYENPVFHAGPRECLGKRLALVEMKTVMAELIRSAKFRLAVPPAEVLPDTSATLGMSSGLKCGELNEEDRAPSNLATSGAFRRASAALGDAADAVLARVEALRGAGAPEPLRWPRGRQGSGGWGGACHGKVGGWFNTPNGTNCPLHGAWRLRFTTAADATFTRNSSRGTAKVRGAEISGDPQGG
eukprot:Skav235755  [mRNA]  locus=scaffold803:182727:196874:+ [translate_table: standard]